MYELSDTVRGIDEGLWYILGVSIVLTVAITAVMLFFVVFYSRKRNPRPRQIEGNLPLELAWTIIPILISLYMFHVGWAGYDSFRDPAPGAMEIDVYGQQFRWDYEYPNGKSTVADLVLPAGKPVKLNLISRDVNHSFFLPDYKIKEDVVPGLDNTLGFTPLVPGTYTIFCAEYCGLDHSGMLGRLIIKPAREFYDWYNQPEEQAPVSIDEMMAASPAQLERGQSVYNLHCASCHGQDGLGEELPEARNFHELDGWRNGPKVSEIFRTLAQGIDGTQMASFKHLPVEDRFALAHYVRSFITKEGLDPGTDTEAELAQLDQDYSLSEGSAAPPEIPVDLAMQRLIADARAGRLPDHGPRPDRPSTVTLPLSDGLYRD